MGKSKCSADSSCMYFSLWSTGGLNWCHPTSGCAQLAQQSWHTITVYQKSTTATTTMTTTIAIPTPDDYLILHGPGHDYCNAGHIASSESDGYEDCKSRCSAESSCTYFSLWSTGGANWCHLTSGCAQLAQQSKHTITIYQKRSTPDATPTTAFALDAPTPAPTAAPTSVTTQKRRLTAEETVKQGYFIV